MISSGFRDSWKYNESLSAISKYPKDSRYIVIWLIVNVLQIIAAAVFTVSCELLTNSRAATAANRGKCCRCGSGRSVESALCGLWTLWLRMRYATTAANRGKCCRCGSGRRVESALCGLWTLWHRMRHTATAANRGKCCRCGSGRRVESALCGLWTLWLRMRHAATAANRGKCCRCGSG